MVGVWKSSAGGRRRREGGSGITWGATHGCVGRPHRPRGLPHRSMGPPPTHQGLAVRLGLQQQRPELGLGDLGLGVAVGQPRDFAAPGGLGGARAVCGAAPRRPPGPIAPPPAPQTHLGGQHAGLLAHRRNWGAGVGRGEGLPHKWPPAP